MITTNKQEMSKSLYGNCENYMLEAGGTYQLWCVYYKDIFRAIHTEKIIVERKCEPIDRLFRYNIYGLVYCNGYKLK